jgi:hypothetical protein
MNPTTAADAIAQAINASLWLVPAANVMHILGFVLIVGPVLAFDFRILGLTRSGAVRDLARALLPWPIVGALLAVPAGLLLFASESTALLSNGAFRLKLLLLTGAGANAVVFHLGAYRSAAGGGAGEATPGRARLHAGFSIVLWLAILTCGRMIAYL